MSRAGFSMPTNRMAAAAWPAPETEAPERVIEQLVDLAMQLQDRADWPARRWQVVALHRQGRAVCCSCCSFLNQFQEPTS